MFVFADCMDALVDATSVFDALRAIPLVEDSPWKLCDIDMVMV